MSNADRKILERFLTTLGRRRRVDAAARRLLDGSAAWLLALWCVGALDALFGFGLVWRLGLLAVLAAGAVAGVAWVGRTAWTPWDLRPLARWAEQRLQFRDNRLILAMELTQTPRGSSEALCRMAVDQGAKAVERTEPRALIDPNPNRRAARRLATVALGVLCTGLLLPRVSSAVVPRLLDPWGDHPPFTLVDFDVRVAPETVRRGAAARIELELSGWRRPDRASVVWAGDGQTSVPMTPLGEGRFVLRLDRVEGPKTFHIATPRGRSRRYSMDVSGAPQWVSFEARLEPPAGSPTVRPVDGGVIRAPVGTRVTLRARADVPLSRGDFTWRVERAHRGDVPPAHVRFEPDPQDPTVLQHTFELNFDAGFALRGIGADGAASEAVRRGAFKAIVPAIETPPEDWSQAAQTLEQRIASLEQALQDLARRLASSPSLTETDLRDVNAAEASAASIDLRLRELAASADSEAQRRVVGSLDERLSAARRALSRAATASASDGDEAGSGRSTTEKPAALSDAAEPFATSGVEVLDAPQTDHGGSAAARRDAGVPTRYRDLAEAYERWLSRRPAP